MKNYNITIQNEDRYLSIEEIANRLIYLNDETRFLLVKTTPFTGNMEVVTFGLDAEEEGIEVMGVDGFYAGLSLDCEEDCDTLAGIFENLEIYEEVTWTHKWGKQYEKSEIF